MGSHAREPAVLNSRIGGEVEAAILTTGMIFDIKRFSIHDGPGIRTTVFFKGCPLNCWWCHNPESQALEPEMMFRQNRCIRCEACRTICEQGAISWDDDVISTDAAKCTLCGDCVEACYAEARELIGQEMTAAQVMAEIERDIAFYDESGGGATFSGGEPLWQIDFLLDLLRACQEKDIHTAVDTCGFATWETIDSVREYVDLFLYDLKLMNDAKHREFTTVSNQLILSNLQALADKGENIILRVPIIPEINDAVEDLRQLGAFAATLPHVNQMSLLPYHPTAVEKYRLLHRPPSVPPDCGGDERGGRHEIRPPSDGRMAEIAEILSGLGLQVKVGG